MKGKEHIITLFYKIFMILIVLSQAYSLIFQVVNLFTLMVNIIIILYVIFRFYLLNKLCKRVGHSGVALSKLISKECPEKEE